MYIFWFDNQQVMRQLVNISLEVLKLLSKSYEYVNSKILLCSFGPASASVLRPSHSAYDSHFDCSSAWEYHWGVWQKLNHSMSSLGSERAEVLSYVSFLQINIYKPLMGIARYVSFMNIFSTSCSLPSAIDDGS